ncbi:MAG: radical SAM family heme chaperone HemW [Erysipelothrix sp.]|nr:radical SAM family heme chaperone HemW [Erysipelothrix sp.]
MARGLYVHIPFCDAICAYCDFARVLNKPQLVDQYLDVLKEDVLKQNLEHIETIYIGGGTPSALTESQLEVLFKILQPYTHNIKEYTIEINPESITLEKAKLMHKYGVNRASLGMQVTQERLLKIINRRHTVEQVKQAIAWLHEANIHHISVDLMYGIPTQTLADFEASIQTILSFDIDHISLYALTIEPDSIFGHLGYEAAEHELDADMYEMAIDRLKQKDFNRYEISNFAKANGESLHNQIYWEYDDFVGVGLHASGKEKGTRYTNVKNLRRYLNGDNEQEIINLDHDEQMFEFIMMNLRMQKGFEIRRFNQLYNTDFLKKYAEPIKKCVNNELLAVTNDRIKATDKGLDLLFSVLEEFMEV